MSDNPNDIVPAAEKDLSKGQTEKAESVDNKRDEPRQIYEIPGYSRSNPRRSFPAAREASVPPPPDKDPPPLRLPTPPPVERYVLPNLCHRNMVEVHQKAVRDFTSAMRAEEAKSLQKAEMKCKDSWKNSCQAAENNKMNLKTCSQMYVGDISDDDANNFFADAEEARDEFDCPLIPSSTLEEEERRAAVFKNFLSPTKPTDGTPLPPGSYILTTMVIELNEKIVAMTLTKEEYKEYKLLPKPMFYLKKPNPPTVNSKNLKKKKKKDFTLFCKKQPEPEQGDANTLFYSFPVEQSVHLLSKYLVGCFPRKVAVFLDELDAEGHLLACLSWLLRFTTILEISPTNRVGVQLAMFIQGEFGLSFEPANSLRAAILEQYLDHLKEIKSIHCRFNGCTAINPLLKMIARKRYQLKKFDSPASGVVSGKALTEFMEASNYLDEPITINVFILSVTSWEEAKRIEERLANEKEFHKVIFNRVHIGVGDGFQQEEDDDD